MCILCGEINQNDFNDMCWLNYQSETAIAINVQIYECKCNDYTRPE